MGLLVILCPTEKWGTKTEIQGLDSFCIKMVIFELRGSIYANSEKQKSI